LQLHHHAVHDAQCTACVAVLLQAAAAASVAGVGLGVMPLSSMALGIDPGFINFAGEDKGLLL
jgi:hypothetical protein